MWIATKHGFFSIVRAHACKEVGQENYVHKPHPGLVMVRARVREHLEALVAAHGDLIEPAAIAHSTGTDYPYRVIIDKDAATALVRRLAMEIDYTNFKNTAHDARPGDRAYHRFLMDTWRTGYNMTQDAEPRTTPGGTQRPGYGFP